MDADRAARGGVRARRRGAGWHMNKRSWFTLVLNGSLPLRRIQSLIRRSRDLALRR